MKEKLFTGSKFFFVFFLLTQLSAFSQTWLKRANLTNTGRDGAFGFTIGAKIYVGGGFSHNDFWEYDIAANTWTQKAALPVLGDRYYGVSFSINGKGYFGLGFNGPNYNPNQDFYEYDPISDAWTAKANFPGTPRAACGYFVINNIGYVGGGGSFVGVANDFYAYDPVTDSWTSRANYPLSSIEFPGTFVIDNEGYFITGAIQINGAVTNATYAYNPTLDTWTAKANFPATGRMAVASFEVGGKGYVGLGNTSDFATYYSAFYTYDPNLNQWSTLLNTPLSKRAWPTAVTYNNKAYVGLGFGNNVMYNDWWEFSPFINTVSINEQQENSLNASYYPNPFNDVLTISCLSDNNEITVSDFTGQILTKRVFDKDLRLTMNSYPSGCYFIMIKNDQGISTKKIIKN